MATIRRRRPDPAYPVTIYTPQARTGSRLGHEHDQNDAMNARLDWVDNLNGQQKARVEAEVQKAVLKYQETRMGNARFILLLILFLLIFSPMVYAIEVTIFKRIFG